MRKTVLVGMLGLLIASTSFGQSFFAMRRERTLILTVGTGVSSYFGELTNEGAYLQGNPNFHAGLMMYVNRRIAIRSELSWFEISGDDAKAPPESGRPGRNLSFHSDNFELSAVGIYDFYPHGRSFYQRPSFNLYGFLGIGLLYFNPKTTYQGQTISLPDQHTELVSYSTFTPVIPLGLGVRFKVSPFLNLSFEGGFRKTFTDYLDDVSTVHHDPSKFPGGATGLPYLLSDRRGELNPPEPYKKDGEIRGNPKTDDAYMLFSVKVEYYLPTNFLQGSSQQSKTFKSKRKSFYRYNKRGGLKK